ncbi:MAG: response regulator [Cohaesibacteraceae bacterium]|nr:response regulator [Cohaesibacteraceae bacterium]
MNYGNNQLGCVVAQDGIMVFTDLSFLIIDDNTSVCQRMKDMLRAFGVHEVASTCQSRRALDMLAHSRVDIILLDWIMSGFSGAQFLRELRTVHNAAAMSHVIVVTGYTERLGIIEAAFLGADMILSKPVTPQVFYEKICNLIHLKRTFIQVDEYLGPLTLGHVDILSDADLERAKRENLFGMLAE